MTGRQAFEIWAPPGARWVDWVRPVPFVAPPGGPAESAALAAPVTPAIAYVTKAQPEVALVVDLPGAAAVAEGVALAGLGFRPVPLYNGTSAQPGAMEVVENHALAGALRWGAGELARLALPPNAPPAFLLDSNRTHRHKMDASVFDNSWDIYDQDMPSAEYLLANGIRRVVVRGEGVQKDLARILYKYQKKGLAIYTTDGYSPPQKQTLRKPPRKQE